MTVHQFFCIFHIWIRIYTLCSRQKRNSQSHTATSIGMNYKFHRLWSLLCLDVLCSNWYQIHKKDIKYLCFLRKGIPSNRQGRQFHTCLNDKSANFIYGIILSFGFQKKQYSILICLWLFNFTAYKVCMGLLIFWMLYSEGDWLTNKLLSLDISILSMFMQFISLKIKTC